jgi:signal transduction histidine kinase
MVYFDLCSAFIIVVVIIVLIIKQRKLDISLSFIIISFALLSFVALTNVLEIYGHPIWDKFEDPVESLFTPIFIFSVFSFCLKYELNKNKQKEAELIKAKERVEKEERLKTAFLYNLSHEIRTPMNGIIGFSEILVDSEISKQEQHYYIQLISNSCQNLVSVVDDIIEISKITVGDLSVIHRNVNVNELLVRLKDVYHDLAESKSIKFELLINHNADCFVFTDESKLYRIIDNLLNNAMKFTVKGKVQFGYEMIGKEISFFVEDTGIGISKEHHKEVFENFRQVETSFNRRYGGTGLGLSISKGLVEILGGKLHLYSELGKGTRVSFTLPQVLKK